MKNSSTKSKFYLILILMLIIASGTSYFAYSEYKEYKGDKFPTVSSSSSEDLSGYPIGVQNRSISVEYYNLIMEISDRHLAFSNTSKSLKSKIDSDESANAKYIELLTDEIVFLNSIDYSPINDIEKEIHEYYSSALYHHEKSLNYHLKYRNTKESVYLKMGKDEGNSFEQDILIAYNIMDKYQLFPEE